MKHIIILIYFICSTFAASNIFYGLNYGINKEACPTLESVKKDFRVLSKYTNTIRIYSVKDCNLGELALKASQANRMRLYLGMWVDKTDSFDQELYALQNLILSNGLYNVEGIIVGSEVMYRDDVPSETLVDHINKVKMLVQEKNVPVTTSDVYYKFYPNIVDAVDFLMMNAFIYWEGENVENAANTLHDHVVSVQNLSKGKLVRISETGWPDNGAAFKDSIPTPETQREFLLKSLCMAKTNGIDMIWFSAFDEDYKPAGVEGHFGLLDSNRQLKKTFKYGELANPCSSL